MFGWVLEVMFVLRVGVDVCCVCISVGFCESCLYFKWVLSDVMFVGCVGFGCVMVVFLFGFVIYVCIFWVLRMVMIACRYVFLYGYLCILIVFVFMFVFCFGFVNYVYMFDLVLLWLWLYFWIAFGNYICIANLF